MYTYAVIFVPPLITIGYAATCSFVSPHTHTYARQSEYNIIHGIGERSYAYYALMNHLRVSTYACGYRHTADAINVATAVARLLLLPGTAAAAAVVVATAAVAVCARPSGLQTITA